MRTKLESLVGYLAWREGQATSDLRAELEDPSSEASQFLESTRYRTRALFEPQPAVLALEPIRPRRRLIPLRPAMAAASVLLAAAGALGLGEARLRRLEGELDRRQLESRSDARRLELALNRVIETAPRAVAAPLAPTVNPIESALARVENGLGQIERRIEGIDRPAPAPPANLTPAPEPAAVGADPAIVEIRRDLSALRRELVASDQAGARQVMEIRLGLQEVGNLLRMALNRPPMVVQVPQNNGGGNFPNLPPGTVTPQVMLMIGNLSNSRPQVRLDAVEQLSRMGPAAQGAIPSLQHLLSHETDNRVRAAAQAAIAALQSN